MQVLSQSYSTACSIRTVKIRDRPSLAVVVEAASGAEAMTTLLHHTPLALHHARLNPDLLTNLHPAAARVVLDSGVAQGLEVQLGTWQAIIWAPGMNERGRIDIQDMELVPDHQIGLGVTAHGVPVEVPLGPVTPPVRVVAATSPPDSEGRDDDETLSSSEIFS